MTQPRRSGPVWPGIIWLIAAAELTLLLTTVPIYPAVGLSIDLRSAVLPTAFLGLIACAVLATWRDDDSVPQMFLALLMLITCTAIIGPAQYIAAALNRPLIDPALAAADTRIGISVPALTGWTAAHPWLREALHFAYFSLLPQFVLPIFVLGAVKPDMEKLWEYIFHFHVCGIATLVCLAIWPAACVFTYLGHPSLIDQTAFVSHFSALRAGTFSTIRFGEIEGLVSFPSFHVAGAWMVTWACRKHRVLLGILIPLNVALSAATVMLGAHYAVDLIATAALCAASLALYRVLPSRLRTGVPDSRQGMAAQ